MPKYPSRQCPDCRNHLPACDEPTPTHLCIAVLARPIPRTDEPARSPMFDRDA